ncbi:UNKNOWN [Stylonychia lemnae]|uniref:Pas domain s-box family protein n=1 Tax=Stylonychia lemnae TaxID=5949 RepID=A0A078AD56_STYLE|nr:UNKNOWN [Stylonychia lemnae]|eukprot:CDW78798.1 UNKNOWN [Stylonychia lemnae]
MLFSKTSQGFLIPIQLRLNFTYNQKFGYSFIGIIEKLEKMNLYQDEYNKQQADDFMFVIADQDNVIQDVSESVLKNLKLSLEQWEDYEEQRGKKIDLPTIISNWDDIIQEYGITDDGKDLDLNNVVNKFVKVNAYDRFQQDFDADDQIQCILMFYQEIIRVQSDQKLLRKVILLPSHKHPEFDLMHRGSIGVMSLKKNIKSAVSSGQPNQQTNQFIPMVSPSMIEGFSDDLSDDKNRIAAMSSMSSTSSSNNGGKFASQYAKTHLFAPRVPSILRLNLILFILLLFSYLVISIYNLSSFVVRHSKIIDRLAAFSYINQRNAHIRSILLDVKMIQAISLDIPNLNRSEILPPDLSRTDFYVENLQENLKTITEYQELLNDFIMKNPEYTLFDLDYNNLGFISQNGLGYYQNVSFKHAVDLYATYSSQVDLNNLIKEKIDLNISSLLIENKNGQSSSKTQRSQLEQTLFYISENGLFGLGELGNQQLYMLLDVSYEQSDSSLSTLNIAVFVSIGILSVMAISIFPQLSRMIDKHQKVIKFFNELSEETIEMQLKQSLKFKNNFLMAQAYEQKVEENVQQIHDHQIAAMILQEQQKLDEKIELQNKKVLEAEGDFESDESESIENDDPEEQKAPQDILINENDKSIQKKFQSINSSQMNSKSLSYNQQSNKVQKDRKKLYEIKDSKQKDSSVDDSKDKNSKKKRSKKRLSLGKLSNSGSKLTSSNLADQFLKKINADTINKKLKTFLVILMIGAFLNSSLIISYFQSQVVFKNDKSSVVQLRKFFLREECAYNLITYLRENIIRNIDVQIRIYESSNNSFYLDHALEYHYADCSQNEDQINQLRRNIPDFLSSAKNLLNGFESPLLCNMTFLNPEMQENYSQEQAKACFEVFNGVLQNGLASFIQYVTGIIYQIDLKLQNSRKNNYYSKKFASELLSQNSLQQSTDLILYYLPYANDAVQYTIRNESNIYFARAKSEYLLAFGLFMAFVLIGSIIFGLISYRKLKNRLLDLENLLVLMPLEDIEPKHKKQIEKYLKY